MRRRQTPGGRPKAVEAWPDTDSTIPQAIHGLRLYCCAVRNAVDVSSSLQACAREHGCTDTARCPLFPVWRRRRAARD